VYKVIWLVKFRSDVPRDEVLAWWRGRHGEIAAATPAGRQWSRVGFVPLLSVLSHELDVLLIRQ